MAAEEFDLEVVERLDIGQPHPDGMLQDGLAVEQTGLSGEGQHDIASPVPFIPDRPEDFFPEVGIGHQFGIARGDCHIGFGQHHFQIGQADIKERPAARHLGQQAPVDEARQRGSGPVPARQHHPGLRPAEHPGNSPQVFDSIRFGAAGRSGADFQIGDFGYGGRGAEKRPEPVRFIDQAAIGAERIGTDSGKGRAKARQIGRLRGRWAKACQQGRCRHALKACRPDVGVAVFGGDDLALLGDADAALNGSIWLRSDRIDRRAATPPNRAAAPVEQLHPDAGSFEHRHQRSCRLVQ